ncbi:hypothetical protein GCM10027614_03070 [Micromonospora vulcania]
MTEAVGVPAHGQRGGRRGDPADVGGAYAGLVAQEQHERVGAGSTARTAVLIDEPQPLLKAAFSTTWQPVRSTRSRIGRAAPPSVTSSWSKPHERASSRVASSSVRPRYGRSCLASPRRTDAPAASTSPVVNTGYAAV